MDLIPKSLDAQVTRPTNEVDALMTRIYRIFGKFSAINGFDKPLPTTVRASMRIVQVRSACNVMLKELTLLVLRY